MSIPAPYAFPDVPGLVLEPMTETHLDAAAVLLGEVFAHWKCSGDHDDWGYAAGAAPPCEGPASHARAQLAQVLGDGGTWCTALTFAGRVLQFEILAVADRVAEVALLLRTTRERPSWFWREVERPVVAGLAAESYCRLFRISGTTERPPTGREGVALPSHLDELIEMAPRASASCKNGSPPRGPGAARSAGGRFSSRRSARRAPAPGAPAAPAAGP